MNIQYFTTTIRFRILLKAYRNWIKNGDRIIDVGCGNGIITKLVEDYFQADITACDINNYLIYNLPFINLREKKLSSMKRKFDVAMLNDVLHHIPKEAQEKLLLDCLKITNKVLIFEAEPTLFGKVADIILNKHHYNSLDVPLSFRKINEWQDMFKKLHLKSDFIKIKRPFWYPFSHIAFFIEKI